MTNAQGSSPTASAKIDFDAIIIGAGFSGMYMLHSLRDKLDLNATVFEAGEGVGGTWYWNRYPGARCDSDSYVYCYTFDKNLLKNGTGPSAIRNRMRSCATSSIAPHASTSNRTSSSANGSSKSPSMKVTSFGQCVPTKAMSLRHAL